MKEEIFKIIEKYNWAMEGRGNATELISVNSLSFETHVLEKEISEDVLEKDSQKFENIEKDKNEVGYKINRKNKRLFVIQIIGIVAFGLTILLAIFELFMWIKVIKKI